MDEEWFNIIDTHIYLFIIFLYYLFIMIVIAIITHFIYI
jgi:hypothetical protein